VRRDRIICGPQLVRFCRGGRGVPLRTRAEETLASVSPQPLRLGPPFRNGFAGEHPGHPEPRLPTGYANMRLSLKLDLRYYIRSINDYL